MSVSDPDKGGDIGDHSDDYVRGLEAERHALKVAIAILRGEGMKHALTVAEEHARFQREGQPGEIVGEYLLRTAARREAEFQARCAAAYAKDNARLRALVKAAEWRPNGRGGEACPHCGVWSYDVQRTKPVHAADCPAFTADGVVK